MTKNVIVVDEQGNEYGATYPKRAKGLVKNGRARFVDENKICLACPPNENLEDKEMSENTNVNTQEATATEQEDKVSESNSEISMEYIFTEIKAIREQTEYLNEALKMLESVKSEGPGDVGAAAKANGMVGVVKCRETTNQQILRFYEKVYDELGREKQSVSLKEKTELIKSSFDNVLAYIAEMNLDPEDRFAAVGDVTEHLSQLLTQVLATEK